jgi:flagellar biosynthesis regulator FlaF
METPPCLEILVEHASKRIVIKLINNCSLATDTDHVGRGKDIVRRIVAVADELRYALIVEDDVSKVTIHGVVFELRYVKLLTTGQTWYNALGFYEDDYVRNTACIQQFLNLPQRGPWRMEDIQTRRPSRMMTRSQTKLKASLRRSRRSVRESNTVQEFFTKVWTVLVDLSKKPADALTPRERQYIAMMANRIRNKGIQMTQFCDNLYLSKFSALRYFPKDPADTP